MSCLHWYSYFLSNTENLPANVLHTHNDVQSHEKRIRKNTHTLTEIIAKWNGVYVVLDFLKSFFTKELKLLSHYTENRLQLTSLCSVSIEASHRRHLKNTELVSIRYAIPISASFLTFDSLVKDKMIILKENVFYLFEEYTYIPKAFSSVLIYFCFMLAIYPLIFLYFF